MWLDTAIEDMFDKLKNIGERLEEKEKRSEQDRKDRQKEE